MVKLIAPEEADRLRMAVVEAEKMTAGEIRVLIVGRTVGIDWRYGLPASAMAVIASGLWLARESWGTALWTEWFGAVGLGLAAGLAVGWGIPRLNLDRAVRRRAEREFVRLGIARTAGRTGVLLMLSEAERRAVLLADRTIDEKVPPGTWDGIVNDLVAAVRDGRAADGLVRAVTAVGTNLATHFPRRPDDVNELSDDISRSP